MNGVDTDTPTSGKERSQVGFYHLTRTPLAEALPKLLERSLKTGERSVVRCPDATTLAGLDKAMWSSSVCLWLPHGHVYDGDEAFQPIWLACDDAVPNGARFLFRVDGAGGEDLTGFKRVFDLFDGADPQSVTRARERWRAAKGAGHELAYWKQEETGWRQAG
ncbi:DNA polymerase III subunit chi [Oecophyllibacter saccharovorans]|uniref:DNA polymerase III subunit chi n=1 Tax=Oecophyllibacter saccharovorans TaxID=2558360 RepID=A0A506URA8_9PROT|nr:DNA polymerase III subunit chi [Oecophyllibacter saccharovorans]TPW35887.1 DNA polymerase III subunit chi [Oecophyllibacter saccharovorans]